jgi:LuxR family maltose regulon positive regulatory protein
MTVGDWSTASSLIVEDLALARFLIRSGDAPHAPHAMPLRLTKTNPQASIVRAALALDAGDFETATASLSRARHLTRQKSVTPATELAIAVVDTAFAAAREDWADVLVHAEEAEKLLGEQSAGRNAARVGELAALTLWHKGTALLWLGDLRSAVDCFSSGAVAADRASFAPVGIECLGQLALVQILKGNAHRAGELAAAVGRMIEEMNGGVELCPAADVALVWVKTQQSDLQGARQHADRASQSLREHPDRFAAALLAAIRPHLHVRDQISSPSLMRNGSDFVDPTEPLPSWLESRLVAARSQLLEPSVATVHGIRQLPRIDRVHPSAEDASRGMVRRLDTSAILRARARDTDPTGGTPSVSRDGEADDQDRTSARTTIIEPLTGREIEVLEKIAAHYSTEEIADAMFISVNTVRSHVRSVLRKLSARRRQQAVRVARQLQLIA